MTPIPPSPQNSAQFLKHTRRRKLTVEDFNRALRWSNVEVGDPPPNNSYDWNPMLGSHGWGAHHCGPVIINPQLLGSSYWLQTMGVPLLGCSPPPFRRCVGSVLGRLRRCGMLISAPPSAPCRWQTWPCTPTSPKAAPPPPCAVSDPPQNTPLLLPFSIPKMVTHPRQPPQQAPLVTPPICFLYGFPPPPPPPFT